MSAPYTKPTSNILPTKLTSTDSRDLEEFLILIYAHLEKVPTLTGYVDKANIIPSTAFTSANISKTAEALNGSVDLTSDCLIMADLLRVYSCNFFGDTQKFMAIIEDIIKLGRSPSGKGQPVYRSAVDDFYFQDLNQLSSFLIDNELLVVVYVVSLVAFIFKE